MNCIYVSKRRGKLCRPWKMQLLVQYGKNLILLNIKSSIVTKPFIDNAKHRWKALENLQLISLKYLCVDEKG